MLCSRHRQQMAELATASDIADKEDQRKSTTKPKAQTSAFGDDPPGDYGNDADLHIYQPHVSVEHTNCRSRAWPFPPSLNQQLQFFPIYIFI